MEIERDHLSSTTDSQEIAYDVLNASKTVTLVFWDFSPARAELRMRIHKGQLRELPANFPPVEIEIPPLHMATIPDQWYRGKCKGGKKTNEVYHVLGVNRPMRQTRRRFSGGKILVSSAAPIGWQSRPLNDRAWAEIEAARAKGAV